MPTPTSPAARNFALGVWLLLAALPSLGRAQAPPATERLPMPSAADAAPVELPVTAPAPKEGDGGKEKEKEKKKGDTERIGELEKKLKDLEKQVKANAPKKTPEGTWEDVSGEKWNIKMGGHVQLDYINWAGAKPNIPPIGNAPGTQDYFEFRRLRLVAEGTGYGVYDFRLQMTLEPESVLESPVGTITSPDVKDAYFSMNEIPLLGRWRIGNFFVPFSLEQVTNDTNSVFLERSIPTQGVFAADREVGMAFYNHTEDLNATWCGGMFLDSISDSLKERIDDNQGYRLSGRATWLPYYDEPTNGRYMMHTGVGILHTQDQDHLVRFRARPQIHEGPRFIDSGSIPANSYTTGNLEWAVVQGAFTVQAEAFLSSVNRTTAPDTTVSGAYVHFSYFLTGENRIYDRFGQHGAQFARSVPYSNVFFVPGYVSLGAVELKARYSNLDLNNLNRGEYNDTTFGFNWYWSERTRVMFDWIHPMTSRLPPIPVGLNVAGSGDILAMRFDFNW